MHSKYDNNNKQYNTFNDKLFNFINEHFYDTDSLIYDFLISDYYFDDDENAVYSQSNIYVFYLSLLLDIKYVNKVFIVYKNILLNKHYDYDDDDDDKEEDIDYSFGPRYFYWDFFTKIRKSAVYNFGYKYKYWYIKKKYKSLKQTC